MTSSDIPAHYRTRHGHAFQWTGHNRDHLLAWLTRMGNHDAEPRFSADDTRIQPERQPHTVELYLWGRDLEVEPHQFIIDHHNGTGYIMDPHAVATLTGVTHQDTGAIYTHYRVGGKNPTNLYRHDPDTATTDGQYIGHCCDPGDAAHIVAALNRANLTDPAAQGRQTAAHVITELADTLAGLDIGDDHRAVVAAWLADTAHKLTTLPTTRQG
jgi:hypothetical protein